MVSRKYRRASQTSAFIQSNTPTQDDYENIITRARLQKQSHTRARSLDQSHTQDDDDDSAITGPLCTKLLSIMTAISENMENEEDISNMFQEFYLIDDTDAENVLDSLPMTVNEQRLLRIMDTANIDMSSDFGSITFASLAIAMLNADLNRM